MTAPNLLLTLPLLVSGLLPAQSPGRPKPVPPQVVPMDQLQRELAAPDDPSAYDGMREELLRLGAEDLELRNLSQAVGQAQGTSDASDDLTVHLKAMVRDDGWPTIAMVGHDASNAAIAVLMHSADRAWVQMELPDLQRLASAGAVDASLVAVAANGTGDAGELTASRSH